MTEFDADEYVAFDLDDLSDEEKAARRASGDDVDDSDVDDDDDDDDDLEDAADDEIDFVFAAYSEDCQWQVQALTGDLANDLEELVAQLRRLPGDAGVFGFVS